MSAENDNRPPPPQAPPGAAQPPPGVSPPPSGIPSPSQGVGSAVAAPNAAAIGAQVVDYLRVPAVRAERRPTPRFSVLAAVAGAALIIVGLLSAAALDDVPEALMTVLFLALLAGGYALVWLFRDGPLATAGATASALSLPMLLGAALANDPDASLTPVVVLSLIGWFAAYLIGPGRGHVVYLGLGTGLAAVTVAILAAGDGRLEEPGVGLLWASALIAAAYFGIGYLLDRSDLSGVATAFVGPAVLLVMYDCLEVLSLAGVAVDDFTSTDLSTSNSFFGSASGISLADLILPGILLAALGVGALRYGVASLRRATAWSGAAALSTGLLAFLIGLFGENGILLALVVVVLGAGVIYGAWFLSARIGEADELAEAPSFTEIGLIQAVRDAMPVRTTDPEVWRSFGGSAWFGSPEAASGAPGPGWWIASDGRWYPPQAAASAAPDPRPAPPAAAAAPPSAPAEPVDPRPAPPTPVAPDPRPAPPAAAAAPPPAPAEIHVEVPAPEPAEASTPPGAQAPGDGPVPPTTPTQPAPIDDLPPAPGWRKGSDGRWHPPTEN